jgi:hypothetical protein
MTTPRLNDDVARCLGVEVPNRNYRREGCFDCLRRTAPVRSYRVVMMLPPELIDGECKERIAP